MMMSEAPDAHGHGTCGGTREFVAVSVFVAAFVAAMTAGGAMRKAWAEAETKRLNIEVVSRLALCPSGALGCLQVAVCQVPQIGQNSSTSSHADDVTSQRDMSDMIADWSYVKAHWSDVKAHWSDVKVHRSDMRAQQSDEKASPQVCATRLSRKMREVSWGSASVP